MSGSGDTAGVAAGAPISVHVQAKWGWFLVLGIAFVVGGVVAIALPFAASLAVTAFVAAALVIIGAMQIFQAMRMASWSGYLFQLVVGIIIFLGGIAIWFQPLIGSLALTVLVAAVFIAKGIFQIVLGFRLRPHDAWGWLVVAGVVSLLVGLMIFAQYPMSGIYALGILAGISLIFTGTSYVALALAARRIAGA